MECVMGGVAAAVTMKQAINLGNVLGEVTGGTNRNKLKEPNKKDCDTEC